MTRTVAPTRRLRLRAVGAAALVAVAVGGVTGCSDGASHSSTSSGVVAVEAREADTALKSLGLQDGDPGVVLLDVRTPAEFAQGHVPGAVNLDLNGPGFGDAVSALDKTKSYFVYCHTGNRSAVASRIMHDAGFQDVHDIEGGIAAWSRAGLPVTR